jgi:hypothetical protein
MSWASGLDWSLALGYLVLLVVLVYEARLMMKDDDDDWPPY